MYTYYYIYYSRCHITRTELKKKTELTEQLKFGLKNYVLINLNKYSGYC